MERIAHTRMLGPEGAFVDHQHTLKQLPRLLELAATGVDDREVA
jgi:hypothetical protein